jgi:hypothetical protein
MDHGHGFGPLCRSKAAAITGQTCMFTSEFGCESVRTVKRLKINVLVRYWRNIRRGNKQPRHVVDSESK